MKRKFLIAFLVIASCFACVFGVAACTEKPNNGNGQGTIQTPSEEKPDKPDNPTENDKPSVINVTGVSINKTTLSLEVGDEETLTATVLPSNATDKSVTWKSSDSSVAKVENGKVTALKAGTATITAIAGDKSAACAVTVKAKTVAVTDVTLNKTTLTLGVDDEETLIATVLPSNATDKTVSWGSLDTSVASVSSSGKVTAIKIGTVTIIATADGVSAQCIITVVHKHEMKHIQKNRLLVF
ncbi:MAG: Ig domain-containing protein [Roseburia sp.]|nr:Ig domain-containing protein [Roseburia sp.]